ncbi:hypothetical protein KCU67_g1786, partial [Aureobasidium melanogenum]
MGRTTIKYLFTDEKDRKSTTTWTESLREAQDQYSNCRVVSFTRVKDLNSNWKHEYVQFIVEEETTKDRARVYAERGNEKDLDWVTFGPAETRTTGSKHDKDLPLPLVSFVFGGRNGDDVSRRPTVLQIAEILAAATIVGGGYELFGHSCFWYAYTVTDAVERAFGKFATKKSWRWLDIGGHGGAGFKDAIGLGVPMLFKLIYVGDAEKFKKEREVNMNYNLDDRRTIIDTADLVSSVAADLKSKKNLDRYLNAIEDLGLELQEEAVQDCLEHSAKSAAEVPDKDANWTAEFDELNKDLVKKVCSDPEAAEYLSKYHSYAPDSTSDEDAAMDGMSDQEEQTQKALQIVVGSILKEVEKTG